MPAGLEIKNDNGNVLIDSTYRNFHFIEKRTLTVTASGTYINGYTFSVDGIMPVIVCDSPEFFALYLSSVSGNTFNYSLIKPVALTASVNIYIFDLVSTAISNFGMQVFNASGDCVFDSGRRPMRILRHVTNKIDTDMPVAETVGTRIGGLFHSAYLRWVSADGGAWTSSILRMSMLRFPTTTSYALDLNTASGIGARISTNGGKAEFFIVDLTNFP